MSVSQYTFLSRLTHRPLATTKAILSIKQRLPSILLCCGLLFAPLCQAEAANAAAVKVAFLYNFFKFITWPQAATPDNSYELCFMGANDLEAQLSALEGKSLNNKPLNLHRNVQGKALGNCHMVFIGSAAIPANELNALKGLPVVTVSDKPNFIDQGGIIGLVQDDNHIGFEINLEQANADKLYISAQLLKLARSVHAH